MQNFKKTQNSKNLGEKMGTTANFFKMSFLNLFLVSMLFKMSDGHGKQCLENPPNISSSTGEGHVKDLGGLKCYISGSVDSKIAVVLASDVYGYGAPHLRNIADRVAAAGFFAVVPDFFKGDPYVIGTPFDPWLKLHGPVQSVGDAKTIIEALKSKGITKVGAAGYCWGAKVVVELSKSACIQAAVISHPSLITLEDIQAVKVSISVLGAELDSKYPPDLLKKYEEVLKANHEIDSFVKVFPNVSHGWTLRYKDEDEKAVKAANEAFQDMLNWFVKHLK